MTNTLIQNNILTSLCLAHHGHLEGVNIEGSDLPVAADIVDEFDKAM